MSVLRGSKDGVQLAKEKLLKSVEACAQLETSEICVSEVKLQQIEVLGLDFTQIKIFVNREPLIVSLRLTVKSYENSHR